MSSDAIQVAVAGGVTLVTSFIALRAGMPADPTVAGRTPEAPAEIAASAPAAASSSPARSAGPAGRPRILTGEPVAAEQRKPAPSRALKLIAGIAVLAVAGAFGLLAFVRALISMFDRIGG